MSLEKYNGIYKYGLMKSTITDEDGILVVKSMGKKVNYIPTERANVFSVEGMDAEAEFIIDETETVTGLKITYDKKEYTLRKIK